MEEESKPVSSRIQKEAACDVIIKNYSFLVGHVDAIRIFPQLVSSRLVEPDFRQRLDCRQTDRDKMMALLHELIRCTEETWFDGFTNALSKVPQYRNVADTLLADFAKTLAEKVTNPTEEDASKDFPVPLNEAPPVVKVTCTCTVSGVDEVMKKAMEEAQRVMKQAKQDHNTALSELKKANDRVLQAEKGKAHAEAKKRDLEEKVHEVTEKLNAVDDKLRETVVEKRLLEKKAQSYKDDVDESRWVIKKENMQLSTSNAELSLQLKIAWEKVQKVEGEMAVLKRRVAGLLAEIEIGRKEREEEEVASHECQLMCDAGRQQQSVKEKFDSVTVATLL